MPPIPGIGSFFTNLGFAPTPFPLNILPLFVVVWIVIGLIYASVLARSAPEIYSQLGLTGSTTGESIRSPEGPLPVLETAETTESTEIPVTEEAEPASSNMGEVTVSEEETETPLPEQDEKA